MKAFKITSVAAIAGILLLCCVLNSCKDSQLYREKHGLIKEYNIDYKIQSIRVDDDSEYHIVAVSQSGDVETIHDVEVPWDIEMKFGNYENPIYRVHMSDRKFGAGSFSKEGKPLVLLPINYKIDTFDD